MTNPARLHPVLALIPLMLFGLAGCSDQSRYVMNITTIQPASSTGLGSMQADLVGNLTVNPCAVVQDLATVTVRVEHPGSLDIGPALGAWLTGYRVEFFYYDPITGALTGPISFLTSTSENLRIPAGVHGSGVMTVSISLPLVTFGLKAWSVGATYNGYAGYPGAVPGSIWVERVVARLTVTGEDTTGKKLSAEGSMLVYLENFGPGPDVPGATVTAANWCYGIDMWSYWGNFGGVQP